MTIGIEFETDDITSEHLEKYRRIFKHFSPTRDASIVTDYFSDRDGNILSNGESLYKSSKVELGLELVSKVFSFDTLEDSQYILNVIRDLTDILQTLGENPQSQRAGIHVHVGTGKEVNLRVLKSFSRLGGFMEQIFFVLGGNGYLYRGVNSDGIYCRPITKWGPQVIKNKEGLSQIFNKSVLENSETTSEFFSCMGASRSSIDSYHPSRYVWLNFYSILKHGTLEFRVFNKTLNPFFILAEIELCNNFVNFCQKTGNFGYFKSEKIFDENSVFDITDKEKIISDLEKVIGIMEKNEIKFYYKDILYNIIKITPIPKIKPGFVFSHRYGAYRPFCINSPYIEEGLVRKPNYVDIHILRGEH